MATKGCKDDTKKLSRSTMTSYNLKTGSHLKKKKNVVPRRNNFTMFS